MSHPLNKRERFLVGKRKGRKRAKRYWNNFPYLTDEDERKKLIESNSQSRRNTTKLCSCEMCGNPRKYYREITLQEKKFFEKVKLGS